jgi:hypothetical protein
MNRSTPQQELGSDGVGGMPKEANTPHPNFHIVASLPGLNGLAAKRRDNQISKDPNCKLVRLSRFVIPTD